MANYSLDLAVLNPSGKEPLGPTIAQIYIKTHSRDDKSMLYISPQCVSLSEIEAQCDRLVEEIENKRKKARRQFKK